MSIEVHVPDSVSQAVEALAGGGTVVAGGTALMPRVNTEPLSLEGLVSLRRVGLDEIDVSNGVAAVGAGVTLARLAREDALAFLRPAIETIASPSIRNLATVGGNLFVGQPYGDLAVCLLALDAEVEVVGTGGQRSAPIAELLTSGVGSEELLAVVRFRTPADGEWFFTKAARRRLNSASIVSVAAVIVRDGEMVTEARIALGGAGPRPVRASSAEAALVGGPLDRARVEEAASAAQREAEPFDDPYASAWYRRRVLPIHLRRVLLGE